MNKMNTQVNDRAHDEEGLQPNVLKTANAWRKVCAPVLTRIRRAEEYSAAITQAALRNIARRAGYVPAFDQDMPRIPVRARGDEHRPFGLRVPRRVVIFESELKEACRRADEAGAEEIGMLGFGGWGNKGEMVIHLAVPPGPQSAGTAVEFVFDRSFFQRAANLLCRRFGLTFCARIHSHHVLGLSTPSPGDASTACSIASKNNLVGFVEVILNFRGRKTSGDIEARAFAYVDTNTRKYVQIRIEVLPGSSPYREFLIGTEIVPRQDASVSDYPLERIHYDHSESRRNERVPGHSNVPDVLIRQFERLPTDVQAQLRVRLHKEFVLVTLPLTESKRVSVGYLRAKPALPHAVFLDKEGDELRDVDHLLNPAAKPIPLSCIHRRAVSMFGDFGDRAAADNSGNQATGSAGHRKHGREQGHSHCASKNHGLKVKGLRSSDDDRKEGRTYSETWEMNR